MLRILTRSKRVFSRRLYEEGKIKAYIQDGNREWITLLACKCADGSALAPALIYKSAASSIQDTWLQAMRPEDQVYISSSPSGWTNNDIGLSCLKQVFDRSTKEKAGRSYRLLIHDGQGSHLTMDSIEYCDRNRILLAVYPPRSTYALRPLDVVMFKPFSSAYSDQVAAVMERCQGLTSISKRDFYPMSMAAWEASFKRDTILKAFEATGLSPLQPEVILKRFNQPAQSGQSSDSDSSALSTSDWRKIRQLVDYAVADRDQRKILKLNQTIHRLSVRSVLAEHENVRLKEALINERQRRKRGKALPLEAVEARRAARAAARLIRQEENTREAADRASRQAARRTQRLQQAQKTAQRGKRRRLKTATKAGSEKRAAAQREGGGEALGAAAGQRRSQSQHGRAIKLPAKYR
jgi:hypothetical protein